MKSEDIKKAVDQVLEPFNKGRHPTNPLGNLQAAIEDKMATFGLKVDAGFPLAHIGYGDTLHKTYDIVDSNDDPVMHVKTSTYRCNHSGNYEVNAYSNKADKKSKFRP